MALTSVRAIQPSGVPQRIHWIRFRDSLGWHETRQRGNCGKYVSELFPHLGDCVDDIAFIHSMTAESPIHGSALLMMNSGRLQSGANRIGDHLIAARMRDEHVVGHGVVQSFFCSFAGKEKNIAA